MQELILVFLGVVFFGVLIWILDGGIDDET
jgi:preprotein translocase subunit SecE